MSPEYLVEEMQASIDKFEKGILKHVNAYVSITYDALSQRLKVSAQNEIHNFRSLYVYSDIASFTFIGDTVAPLLRIVPFSHNSKTGYVYGEFKTLHYVSVSKSVVDQVHITIKTNNDPVVPFVTGKNNLKNTFSQKEKIV